MRARLRATWILLLFGAAATDATAGGTLVVKYKSGLDACAETAFEQRRSFASSFPGSAIDSLHEQLEVIEVRSVFMRCAGLSGREASAQWRTRMQRALDRKKQTTTRSARQLPDAIPDLSRVYRLRYEADLPEEDAAAVYESDPMVEYAHPDLPRHIEHIPNDPYFSSVGSWDNAYVENLEDLWNLKVIGAPEAWDISMGEEVVIAVIDTGIDRDHPDIADNIWTNPGETPGNGIDDDSNGFVDDTWGWDFVQADNDPRDAHGHGTHVAGIAAAVGDNGLGILGVAPRAQVMSVRIFAGEEGGEHALEAIVYAAESGADVINNSWGGPGIPGASALDDAVDTAIALGAVVVFAGSNGAGALSVLPEWHSLEAIDVGRASPPLGTSSFSATDADISAPGTQVLSLRGGNGMNGPTVDSEYVVGTGTSMATPHVSGAAALLLSVFPDLTPYEVKWRLEGAAVQWGSIGWEGLSWNPRSGWGLLDLLGAFDPPTITTRLDRFTAIERHEFVDRLSERTSVGHVFTTHDPVAWTTASSPWIQVTPTSGTGDDVVELTIDARPAGVGVHDGSYELLAPATDDGGTALPVRLYAYENKTLGDRAIVFAQDRIGLSARFGINGLTISGSPSHSVLAWNSLQDAEAQGAVLDRAGALVGAFTLRSGLSGQYVTSAFDGRRFAFTWLEHDGRKYHLLLSRLGPDGTPLDATPRDVAASSKFWLEPRIAFDGRRYLVLWTQAFTSNGGANSDLLMLRMGSDFATEKKPVRVYTGRIGGPSANTAGAEVACGDGECIAVWIDQATDGTGVVRALRFVDGEPVGTAFDIASSTGIVRPNIASSGNGYLVIVSSRQVGPCGPTREFFCIKGLLGVRLNKFGQVLDTTPRELITAPADTPMSIELGRIGFDGDNYLLPYSLSNECFRGCKRSVFVSRVSVDGAVLDQDGPRASLLVDESRDRAAYEAAFASTADGIMVGWSGFARDPVTTLATDVSVEARPVATRETDILPSLELGVIGSIALRENERLAVRLVAPAIPAAQPTFSAEGLPEGAVLDPDGVLHWTPAPDDARTYTGIRLMADDGADHAEETISLAVTNTLSSLSGTARRSDGTPVAGMAVRLAGRGFKRTTTTEPDGSFAFFGIAPQSYKLSVGRSSRKTWRAPTSKLTMTGAIEDRSGQDLIVTPR